MKKVILSLILLLLFACKTSSNFNAGIVLKAERKRVLNLAEQYVNAESITVTAKFANAVPEVFMIFIPNRYHPPHESGQGHYGT